MSTSTTTRMTLANLRSEFKSDLASVTEATMAEIARLDARIDAAQHTAPTHTTRTSAPKARRAGAHKADPTGNAVVADSGEAWQAWLAKLTDERRAWVAPMHAAGVDLAEARRTYAAAVATFRGDGVPQDRAVFTRPAIAGKPAQIPASKPAPKPAPAQTVTANGEIAATARLRKAIAMLKGGAAGAIVTELDGVKVRITLEA